MASNTPNMGLVAWDTLTDTFSHTDLFNNWSLIDTHDHTLGHGIAIPTGGIANQAITQGKIAPGAVGSSQIANNSIGPAQIANASIGAGQLANAGVTADKLSDAAKLGLTDSSVVRRGKSIIATTESRTNTAYGLLTTADRVSNIVLPTDGLIAVCYQATWQESVSDAARAALFVGVNQVKVAQASGTFVQETDTCSTSGTGKDRSLFTTPGGLLSCPIDNGPTYGGDVTTGQIVGGIFDSFTSTVQNWGLDSVSGGGGVVGTLGGPCYLFANAGTYDVTVQFKASSGSVTAKNRKLWVWTISFG